MAFLALDAYFWLSGGAWRPVLRYMLDSLLLQTLFVGGRRFESKVHVKVMRRGHGTLVTTHFYLDNIDNC